VIYNIRSRTQAIGLNVLRALMTIARFVGFKDIGGDMVYLHKARALRDTHRPE
jgi:dihydrodipicolinate synthase/N-acetylneuraminate lyase